MPEMLEEQRENWGSRGAFVLAAVGSAVGLGNLWGFPYKLYDHGGGAFLIPYILAIFIIGIPILMLEFSMGHFTQRAAPGAFARCHKKLEFVGWWGIILGCVIITYYPVLLAYCFSFLWYSIQGIFNGTGTLPWAGQGSEGIVMAREFFEDGYLQRSEGLQWHIFWPLILAWLSMYLAIFKGVNLVGKIVWLTVPLPWLMLVILAVRGLTLPGSHQGLAFYLNPVWSELGKPDTWRFAFGQVFFSMSLAFGVMITYSSFLHRKSDINNNAAIIGISDFATSFVAGLAIFATLGGMSAATNIPVDKVTTGGPGLAFVAFPYVLAQLPYSAWFSFIFFFALLTLGIDSAFSITESILAAVVDKTGWKRSKVLAAMSFIGLGTGIIFVTRNGLSWLGAFDGFVNGTWGIGFVGLLECLVMGWFYRLDILRRHANSRSDWKVGRWWKFLVRVVIPVMLGVLFFWSLYDDIHRQGGLFRDAAGNVILANCIGFAAIAVAPFLAFAISFVKDRARHDHQITRQIVGTVDGVRLLIWGLCTTAVSVVVGQDVWSEKITQVAVYSGLAVSAILAIVANMVTDRLNTETTSVSWFVRWSGAISVGNISYLLAWRLIAMVQAQKQQGIDEAGHSLSTDLGGPAYVILSIVVLLVVCGLGWCFYRAMAAASTDEGPQMPDEVGDESSVDA